MATTKKQDATTAAQERKVTPEELAEGVQDRESSKETDSSQNASDGVEDATETEKDTKATETQNVDALPTGAGASVAPPLPDESIPPLPTEAPPGTTEQDDGWAPVWDETAQSFYFYNRFTGLSQWDNPRVPEPPLPGPPGVEPPISSKDVATKEAPVAGGYNPAIHGDYDPTAWYAQPAAVVEEKTQVPGGPVDAYAATAAFNRFTGRFQNPDLNPENFNDENKSRRQLNAFFDVDAASNHHDGRSLKEERSGKKLSKAELKWHKEKRKAKKEEKRRAWLLD